MAVTPHAHPHALPDVAHAPPGMRLPAGTPREAVRPNAGWRLVLEVAGGVAFAMFMFQVARWYVPQWIQFDPTDPWSNVGGEVVFLFAALVVGMVLPSGIRHDITLSSTLEALKLDWPELAVSLWTLARVYSTIGHMVVSPGTLWLALAVGVVEEFFFRVVLLGWLVTKVSAPMALVVSSIVFGVAHSQVLSTGNWGATSLADIVNVAPQIAGGFLLGAIYLRTRNPIGPILAHAMWDYPLFMYQEAVFSGGGPGVPLLSVPQLLPWCGFIVYGLWLVRDGVSLTGRVEPVRAEAVPLMPGPGAR